MMVDPSFAFNYTNSILVRIVIQDLKLSMKYHTILQYKTSFSYLHK